MLVPEALGRVHCIAVEHLICRPATPTGVKYILFILAPFLHGLGGSHQSLIYGSLFLIKRYRALPRAYRVHRVRV